MRIDAMKRLLCLLAAVLLLTGCTGKSPEQPTETEPATKTVFVHSSMTYSSGGVTSRTDYLYNEAELLTEVVVSDGQGAELQRYLVTCDENGNPIEWTSAAGSTVNYTYDAQGRTLRTETYTGETLMTSTEYTWSGSLRISTTVKTTGGDQRVEYTYDRNDALIRQDAYEGGQLSRYVLYTPGDNGKPLTAAMYDPEGNLLSTSAYAYEDGKETVTTVNGQGEDGMINTKTYDPHGNLLSDEYRDSAGNLLSSEVHEWMPIEVPADCPRAGI
jgi:YD repeat-containing protein